MIVLITTCAGYSGTYTRAVDYGILPAVKTVMLVGAPNEEECRMLARALVERTGPCRGATNSQHQSSDAAVAGAAKSPGRNCSSVMPLSGIKVGGG